MKNVLQRTVLQLTASYEPDGVIGVRRSLSLLRRGAAKIVVPEHGEFIHTEKGKHQVPSVVALVRYVDVRGKRNRSKKRRNHIFARDKHRCQYCAVKFTAFDLTLDHIIPQSRGGSDDQENLAASCKPCNQRKGNRTPDEARMPLLATPSALRYGLDRAMMAHYAETRPEWKDYLYLGNGEFPREMRYS